MAQRRDEPEVIQNLRVNRMGEKPHLLEHFTGRVPDRAKFLRQLGILGFPLDGDQLVSQRRE